MLRGEKRALPPDSSPGMASTGGGVVAATAPGAATSPHPHKKVKEKMPDFDWSADNYALTWRLVEELRKPENKNVLFPDHENMAVKSGDTKEDVYRRIAKVVHPEAYAQDPQIAGSRMKNKNVAMWKEYSGYCRRLQELCATHRVVIPAAGPDEGFPHEILAEWRKILISMPAFQALRSFMPVRPEEKPKAPTVKVQRGVSSIPQAPPEEEHSVEHVHNGVNSASYSGPVQSPLASASVKRGLESAALGNVEGHNATINGSDTHIQPSTKLSVADYLELRRSYHEDVRLGIFSPSEIKIRIENLDKQRTQAESSRLMMPPPSSAASTTSTYSQSMTPQLQPRVPLDPMQEQVYEEKAFLLGFRKPSQPNPLSRLTNKEFFKTILEHAAECEMQECRLDNRRMTPQLSFVPSQHPHEAVHVDIAFMTRAGPVPLAHHPLATSIRCLVRNPVHVFDIPLVIHNAPPSWDTSAWDYAHAVSVAALNRRLTIEEIKSVQSHPHLVTVDHATRRQYQLLNEASTVFDVLRLGLLTPNGWTPINQLDEPMDHPVSQQH